MHYNENKQSLGLHLGFSFHSATLFFLPGLPTASQPLRLFLCCFQLPLYKMSHCHSQTMTSVTDEISDALTCWALTWKTRQFKKPFFLIFLQGNQMQNHVLFHENVPSLWESTESFCCLPRTLTTEKITSAAKDQLPGNFLSTISTGLFPVCLKGGMSFCSGAVVKGNWVYCFTKPNQWAWLK